MEKIAYKSYCWHLGTTSFRTTNFNRTIEKQLALLDEFWNNLELNGQNWHNNEHLQAAYYLFMQSKGFVKGDAPNKAKDARQKTSGLEDIGLINSNRRLTPAGECLLAISQSRDFSVDNELLLAKDSFVYLKQLLKTSCRVDDNTVRPLIVLLYVLSRLEYLTTDEFTYLLPLCVSREVTEYIIGKIIEIRNGQAEIDTVITDALFCMPNYKSALNLFLNNPVSDELIMTVGFNRKSRSYDKPYGLLYWRLYEVFFNSNIAMAGELYEATKKINIGGWWRELLFSNASRKKIIEDPVTTINPTVFQNVETEEQFKERFFRLMHLFKAKDMLCDYRDLNRRYLSTTDILLFEESTIKLDIVPKQFFRLAIDELYNDAYTETALLPLNTSLDEISSSLVFNSTRIVNSLNKELGTSVKSIDDAYSIVEKQKYERLHHLIETRFTDEKILKLLDCFDKRDDDEIMRMVTDNADVPTLFEYVLGILWYKVSEYKGRILDYMKLSLDANLMPKSHAAGGEADIVYEYEETWDYPAHTLLLEATLADSTNQRRMEMELVSRHLGNHLLNHGNPNSYCIFATNNLHINVLSDFRGRKNYYYYDTQNEERYIDSMKIIPLQIDDLRNIIKSHVVYSQLYNRFDTAYKANESHPKQWYDTLVKIH